MLSEPTAEARRAADWYRAAVKHPLALADGRWRWVLPDPPTAEGVHDLPGAVFERLEGGAAAQPWIFPGRGEAVDAAMVAAAAAIRDGAFDPPEGPRP